MCKSTSLVNEESNKLVKRGMIALQDKEWNEADEFFKKAIELEPENGNAYLGLFLVEQKSENIEAFFEGKRKEINKTKYDKLEFRGDDVITDLVYNYNLEKYCSDSQINKIKNIVVNYDSTTGYAYSAYFNITELLKNDKNWRRAERFLTDNEKSKIDILKKDIEKISLEQIDKASRVRDINELIAGETCKIEFYNNIIGILKEQQMKESQLLREMCDLENKILYYKQEEQKLGIIKFKEKKVIKEIIYNTENQLEKIKSMLETENEMWKKEKDKLLSLIEKERDVIYNKIEKLYKDKKKLLIKSGYDIKFGTYRGKDIEWKILDKNEDTVLLISKYCIEEKIYNENIDERTWAKSSIRKWLNTEFLKNAFTKAEIEMIVTTHIHNPDINIENPRTKEIEMIRGGADTEDKVFLLSKDELYKYFDSICEKVGIPADYLENNITTYDGGFGAWWLRTPAWGNFMGVCIMHAKYAMSIPNTKKTGVCPVIRVKI